MNQFSLIVTALFFYFWTVVLALYKELGQADVSVYHQQTNYEVNYTRRVGDDENY